MVVDQIRGQYPGMEPLALASEDAENYGLLWWINLADKMPKEIDAQGDLVALPTDAYWGWGLGDSVMMVIPSYDMVITRTGTEWTGDYGTSRYQQIYDKLVFPILSQYSTPPEPMITSTPVTEAVSGQPYSYDVDATGNPVPSYSLTQAPVGMTIDPIDGLLSWTPAATGIFSVTVKASNSEGIDSQAFGIIVTQATAPTITSSPVKQATVGQIYSYAVETTGNPPPTHTLTIAPTGMTIDTNGGQISWTPLASGSFSVTVEVNNSAGMDSQSFKIDVASGPSVFSFQDGVSPTSSYVGTQDSLISETEPLTNFGASNLCGVDGDDPSNSDQDLSTLVKWDIGVIAPGSIVVSASINLNVTNRSTEVYKLYEVKRNWVESEANWNVASSGSSWQVSGANGTLDRGTDVVGTLDAPITGTYVIAINPEGLSVLQSWIDTPGANNGFILSDSKNTDGLDFDCSEVATAADRPKLAINYMPPTSQEPLISSTPLTDGLVGHPYSYDVIAGGTPPPVYALRIAPDGMSIDSASGLISWTPTASGSFSVTVEASNVAGSNSQSYAIDLNQIPSITSTPTTNGTVGLAYSYYAEASGSPAPTYSLTTSHAGMTINPVSGLIRWTPTTPGSFSVTVEASNVAGSDSQSYAIDVNQVPSITSTPTTDSTVGLAYSYDAEARGSPAPVYSLTTSPAGMIINPVSGLIRWTPTTPGSFSVTVEASNTAGTDSQSFTVDVASGPTTISFQDGLLPVTGYSGTDDALISEYDPAITFGTSNICGADGSDPRNSGLDVSTLLRWAVDDIPAGSMIDSVSIALNVTGRSHQTYDLYEIKRTWVEAEANWDIYAKGNSWQVAGALGTQDRSIIILGVANASITGLYEVKLNASGVVLVQSWVDDPTKNHGLVFVNSSADDDLDFDCSEVANAADRPKLTINYIPPTSYLPLIWSTPITDGSVPAP